MYKFVDAEKWGVEKYIYLQYLYIYIYINAFVKNK